MITIHESMMKLQYLDNLDVGSLFYPKFIFLLKQVFDIDLSNETNPFQEVSQMIGDNIDICYLFKYGSILVSTHKENTDISVYVTITDSVISDTFPYKSTSCSLKLDHDMNFIQASFDISLEFSHSYNNEYSLLQIRNVLSPSSRIVKTFTYSNQTQYSVSKDLKSFGLSSNFFTANKEFDDCLIDFLTCCSETPKQFYDEFPEYPNYDKLISTVEGTVQLLSIFNKQYIDDKDLLKSRLLLTEMCLI